MSLVLGILATIGYVLLAILALVLLVVLLVLFCPVKYSGRFEKTDKIEAKVKVSYLLFIRFNAEFSKGVFSYILKIFGKAKKSNIESVNEQIENDKKRKDEKKEKKRLKGKAKKEAKQEAKKKLEEETPKKDLKRVKEDVNDKVEVEEVKETKEVKEVKTIKKVDKTTDEKIVLERIDDKQLVVEKTADEKIVEEKQSYKEIDTKKSGISEKLGKIKNKLISAKEKIILFFGKIKKSLSNLEDFFNEIERRYNFVTSNESQKLIAMLFKRVKKLIKHILPRRIKGYLQFGFSSPETTGKLLAAIALFYPKYRKSLRIEPVFTESVLNTEIEFKGHITIFVLLFAAARVYFSKKYKALWNEISKPFSDDETSDEDD